QLAHARGVGQRVAQRSDEAQGVALVAARVGVGRLHQLVVVAGASGAAETDDLVADVAASISSSSPLPSAVSRTAVAPVSAPPARMTSLAIVAPGHHGSVSTRTPADATSAPAHASSVRRGRSFEEIRRRPTLPGSHPPSTIGAGGLHFRVRDGNGCFPAALTTGNRRARARSLVNRRSSPAERTRTPSRRCQALGRLAPVG